MKDNKKMLQILSLALLFVAVVCISVGFAALSTSLTVTGAAKVIPATWKIKFTANSFNNYSTSATSGSTTPTMTDTTFSGYEIVLSKPGDKGSYTVTVENQGSIDAALTTVNLGDTLTYAGSSAADEQIVRDNVTYTLTWADGTAIAVGDTLAHGTSKDLIITAEYSSTATQIPEDSVTITGRDLTMIYSQN